MMSRDCLLFYRILACTVSIFGLSGLLMPAWAITLEEAIKSSLGESYVVKEQEEFVKASRFSYISTIDAFLPRFDIDSSYVRTISPTTPISTFTTDLRDTTFSRDAYTFTGTISWRVFDGGERLARRRGAFSAWGREKERFKSVREEVLSNIKNAFYLALGAKMIVGKRQEAVQSSQKIYNLIRGRYDEGVAKKSELLQAEVRLLNAKIDLQKARKEYEKSMETV
jgi:outer membrane protein TolC